MRRITVTTTKGCSSKVKIVASIEMRVMDKMSRVEVLGKVPRLRG